MTTKKQLCLFWMTQRYGGNTLMPLSSVLSSQKFDWAWHNASHEANLTMMMIHQFFTNMKTAIEADLAPLLWSLLLVSCACLCPVWHQIRPYCQCKGYLVWTCCSLKPSIWLISSGKYIDLLLHKRRCECTVEYDSHYRPGHISELALSFMFCWGFLECLILLHTVEMLQLAVGIW